MENYVQIYDEYAGLGLQDEYAGLGLQDAASSFSGRQLPQHQQDLDADSDETEVEREFRDELQSQVSQLMDGALL